MTKKLLILVLLLAPMSLFAQKFAHFSYADVMQALPAYRTAAQELQTLGKQYENNINEMRKEFQTKLEKYQKEVNEQTPENIVKRQQQELESLQARIQQATDDNQSAYNQQSQQKMQPIIQRVLDAVNQIAKEGGYVYVIDQSASQQAGIFINDSISEDVTKKVQDKLGITAADIQAGKAFAQQLQKDAQAAAAPGN